MSLFDFRFELQAQSRVVLELDEPRESITWNRIGDNDVFENGELNQVYFNPLSLEDCRRNFYNYNMFRILVSCSVRKDESEDEWEEYKKQLLDYINENFALFNEVVSTKIEDTPNETISAYEFWDLVSSRLGISKLWRQIYLGRKKVGDKVKIEKEHTHDAFVTDWIPGIGDMVLCLMMPGGDGEGYILGGIK